MVIQIENLIDYPISIFAYTYQSLNCLNEELPDVFVHVRKANHFIKQKMERTQEVLLCHNLVSEDSAPGILRGTLQQKTSPRVELEWISLDAGKSSTIPLETSLTVGEEALLFFQQFFNLEVSSDQCILFSDEGSETGFILENAEEWVESFRAFRVSQMNRKSNRHLVECPCSGKSLSSIFDILAIPEADEYWKQIRITYSNSEKTSHEYFMLDITYSHLYEGALDIFNSLKPRLSVLDQHLLVSFLFDVTREHMASLEDVKSYFKLLKSEPRHQTDKIASRKSLQNALENCYEFDIGDAVGEAFNVLYIQKLYILSCTNSVSDSDIPDRATKFELKYFKKGNRKRSKTSYEQNHNSTPLNLEDITHHQKQYMKNHRNSMGAPVDRNRYCGCSTF